MTIEKVCKALESIEMNIDSLHDIESDLSYKDIEKAIDLICEAQLILEGE